MERILAYFGSYKFIFSVCIVGICALDVLIFCIFTVCVFIYTCQIFKCCKQFFHCHLIYQIGFIIYNSCIIVSIISIVFN